MDMGIIRIALPALLGAIGLAYVISLYNELVRARVNVDKSWANISVLEKQRYDELPRLVEVCNGYMKYEKDTLERITRARTQFLEARTPPDMARADQHLEGALNTLFATVENYPDLKAVETFLRLQKRISALESEIADRREFFNDSVTVFNTRIGQVPYTVIADTMGYAPLEMYKVPENEKETVAVKLGA